MLKGSNYRQNGAGNRRRRESRKHRANLPVGTGCLAFWLSGCPAFWLSGCECNCDTLLDYRIKF